MPAPEHGQGNHRGQEDDTQQQEAVLESVDVGLVRDYAVNGAVGNVLLLPEGQPGNGKRFLQNADGIDGTLVAGELIYSQGKATGALPGKLIRGMQAAPP